MIYGTDKITAMVHKAYRDGYPKQPYHLRSGMVFDLNGYIMSWAEAYTQKPYADTVHALRRLEEALEVVTP